VGRRRFQPWVSIGQNGTIGWTSGACCLILRASINTSNSSAARCPAIVPKGSPVFDEFAEFRAEVADQMRTRAGITDAQIRIEMHPVPAAEKGLENWEWVQAIGLRNHDRA
jgi:hypothetical protein